MPINKRERQIASHSIRVQLFEEPPTINIILPKLRYMGPMSMQMGASICYIFLFFFILFMFLLFVATYITPLWTAPKPEVQCSTLNQRL